MIKLVALDLDDTLLDSELKISPDTAEAIRNSIELGVTVTLATGRMYRSALPYALELGLNVPLVTYHGALVKTSHTKEVLYNRPVPMALAREVLGFVAEHGLDVNLYMDDQLYIRSGNSRAEDYIKLARVPCQVVPDLAEAMVIDPEKLMIIDDPHKVDRLAPVLKDLVGDRLHITKSKPSFIEVTHPQGTKGHALAALAAEMGISRDQIMAVGDSYNDLDMLEYAGVGVAMANAVPEAKSIADFVTRGNDEHGVAEALKKFVLAKV